jgi:asparagine synthase (glutamine-hydrolysing)
MCGIAGIFDLHSSQPVTARELERMVAAIAHRGPDGRGVLPFRGGGLASVRLAILDLRPESDQPFESDDGERALVYNGEIFNYRELRAELAGRGHRFRTECDTEVVLRAFEEWGPSAVTRFNGMWAFAIYDRRKDQLFCSRDRFGIKPFYYAVHRGQFLFASEAKALLAVRRELAVPDYESLGSFLRANAPATPAASFFESIAQLLPAHNLFVDRSGLRTERYWSYPVEPLEEMAVGEPAERVRELLTDSIRLRLRSDVPVASALSGGIDSSGVVALLRRVDSGPHRTFTASYPDDPMDEAPRALTLASKLGMESHVVRPSGAEFLDVLADIVHHVEAPNASLGSIPQWYVMREMRRRGIGVALEGQGADELFGGYENANFPWVLIDRLRAGRLREARDEIAYFTALWGARAAAHRVGRVTVPPLYRWVNRWRGDEKVFIGPVRRAKPPVTEATPDLGDALTKTLHGQHTGVLRRLLLKGDAISMAHSIESRLPYLDYRLVEFVFRLPGRLKARDGHSKAVLRDALRADLPAEVLARRRKTQLSAPLARWLRERPQQLIDPILRDERCRRRGLFDPDQVDRLVRRHLSGRADHSASLFWLISCELWLRRFIDANGAGGP